MSLLQGFSELLLAENYFFWINNTLARDSLDGLEGAWGLTALSRTSSAPSAPALGGRPPWPFPVPGEMVSSLVLADRGTDFIMPSGHEFPGQREECGCSISQTHLTLTAHSLPSIPGPSIWENILWGMWNSCQYVLS